MKYKLSNTTTEAIRKKTSAVVGTMYQTEDGLYLYDANDKTTPENAPAVLVSPKKNLRFILHELKTAEKHAPTVYKNTAKTFTANCGEGFTGSKTVTVEAGKIESQVSQADADNRAQQLANELATAGLICVPNIVTPPETTTGKRVGKFNTHTTTGSIEKGSDILQLAGTMALEVGDDLIIFIGGEDGKGKRGTESVGEPWPPKYYHTREEMEADKSQPEGTWAAVVGENKVNRFYGTWLDYSNGALDALVPWSLGAKIIEILNPTKVRLDRSAEVSSHGAKVVADNAFALVEYVKEREDKTFKAADLGFTAEDVLYISRVKWEGQEWRLTHSNYFQATDITILLDGMTLASAPGYFPASVAIEYGNGEGNVLVKGGKIIQNGTYEGLGFARGNPAYGVPEANENFGNPWLSCPAIGGWTKGFKMEDITVINPSAYAFHAGHPTRCGVIITKGGLKHYNGWAFVTFTGHITDCFVDADHLIRALEIEGGDGGKVIGFKMKNGIAASNSSWNALFQNLDFRFTKNAALDNPALLDNPMFEIHAHIKGSAGNILIENVNVNYDDYIDEEGGLLRDFVIKPGVDGLTIRNVTINKPPVIQPYGRGNGYAGSLRCGGNNVLIEDFTTNAKMGAAFGREGLTNSPDNTCISVTGDGCTLRRVKAESAVIRPDTIVEDCEFTYGFTRM